MAGLRIAGELEELENISRELQAEGKSDLADRVRRAVEKLRSEVPEPDGGLMTTGEAAQRLGIRSVTTIKRWVQDGMLEGFRRGGRILVSRDSVDRMLAVPALAQERDHERRLADDLDAIDTGDRDVPPTHWIGHRPWEENRVRTDAEKSAGQA